MSSSASADIKKPTTPPVANLVVAGGGWWSQTRHIPQIHASLQAKVSQFMYETDLRRCYYHHYLTGIVIMFIF
jgi:hypothetical protein